MIGSFQRIVDAGIVAGEFRPVDPRKTIISLGSLFYGTVMFACYVENDFTLVDLMKHTMESFLRGIRTDRVADRQHDEESTR